MSNSTARSLQKDYFKTLLQKSGHTVDDGKEIVSIVTGSMKKIEEELASGNLSISSKSIPQEDLVRLKKDKYAKEMEVLSKEIHQNDEMYRKARRELLMQKKAEAELKKSNDEAKIREVNERVKKWSEIQKQLKEKREQMEEAKRKMEEEAEERIKKQAEEQKEFQKLEKKKHIQQSLKKIQENKMKRDEIIKASEQQYQQLHPKYLEIQKKFKQLEEEMKFQQEILKKNHKLSLKIDHQAIKAHERAYLTKVEERKVERSQSHSPKSADGTREKDFTQFFAKNEEKLAQEKQKLKRRREFQEKLKEIPVVIDEAKKVKVEIAIDKGKNRIKYNFLSQKALNDFQIFGQFQDFELNVNPRQIGKEYLRQLPEITKNSRIVKSNSVSTLKETSDKIKYKDYLQDMKSQRTQRGGRSEQEINQIIKQHKSKSKAIEELNQKSKHYQIQAKRKLSEMQKYNGLQSVLKKSKEVDDIYLKSIKAKLACLEMQE